MLTPPPDLVNEELRLVTVDLVLSWRVSINSLRPTASCFKVWTIPSWSVDQSSRKSLQSGLVKSMSYFSEDTQVFVCENTHWRTFGTLAHPRVVALPVPSLLQQIAINLSL